MTLATISHSDAYVYNPCPILSIWRKLVKLLSATTGLNVTWTFDIDGAAVSIPSTKELIKLNNPNPCSKKAGKLNSPDCAADPSAVNKLKGKIDSNSKKNRAPIIAPKGKFCVYYCPVSINSTNRRLSIIITNKNKMAIAPT